MNKLEEMLSVAKISELLQKREQDKAKEDKKKTTIIVIAVIAGLALWQQLSMRYIST